MKTNKSPYAPFSDLYLIIQQLVEDKNVELLNVELDPDKNAYRMHRNLGECCLGGIKFKLRMGGRPANEKVIMNVFQAASQQQGTALSAAQCRAALMKWMFEESERLFKIAVGDKRRKNTFNIDDYQLIDDDSNC